MARILIAEEQLTSRIVLKVKLAAASHEVFLADGFPGLMEASERHRPELIIIPKKLGSMAGPEICHALKLSPMTADTPVLLVCGQDEHKVRAATLTAGAADIVDLPFYDPLLLGRVRNALRASSLLGEFGRREHTANELGLAEPRPLKDRSPTICFVEKTGKKPSRLLAASHAEFGAESIRRTPYDKVLDEIQQGKYIPDMVVISSAGLTNSELLQMTAEIRSHPTTRLCAIVLQPAKGGNEIITALDVGASDLLPPAAEDNEIRLRLRNQLAYKFQMDSLRQTVDQGLMLAARDPLTGLFNRRYAKLHGRRIAKEAIRRTSSFAVLLMDLDHFKKINDTLGHGAGDVVLETFARRLKTSSRCVDLLARVGGEEFLVVMPDMQAHMAIDAAERLKRCTTRQPIPIPGTDKVVQLTVSIGLVIGNTNEQADTALDDLIGLADKALLASKAAGRNQVTFCQSAA